MKRKSITWLINKTTGLKLKIKKGEFRLIFMDKNGNKLGDLRMDGANLVLYDKDGFYFDEFQGD